MTTSPLIPRLVTAVVLGTISACCPSGWQEPENIPFGVSADLAAVTSIHGCNALQCWLAVGSNGTVAWAQGNWGAKVVEYEVESWGLGGVDLTDVLTTATGWWVVGEGGTMEVSEDAGNVWEPVDLGTSANLYGIAEHGDRLVVVGDEVVVVQQPDGSWAETTAPSGGWGRLRGVYSDDSRVYTVGLGGIAWSAADPGGDWIVEDVGVDTDLFAVGHLRGVREAPDRVAVVGAQGTLVVGDRSGRWTRIATKTTVDLLDVSHSMVLAADGGVFSIRDGSPSRIDTLSSGVNALYSTGQEIGVVGDGGMAQYLRLIIC